MSLSREMLLPWLSLVQDPITPLKLNQSSWNSFTYFPTNLGSFSMFLAWVSLKATQLTYFRFPCQLVFPLQLQNVMNNLPSDKWIRKIYYHWLCSPCGTIIFISLSDALLFMPKNWHLILFMVYIWPFQDIKEFSFLPVVQIPV